MAGQTQPIWRRDLYLGAPSQSLKSVSHWENTGVEEDVPTLGSLLSNANRLCLVVLEDELNGKLPEIGHGTNEELP